MAERPLFPRLALGASSLSILTGPIRVLLWARLALRRVWGHMSLPLLSRRAEPRRRSTRAQQPAAFGSETATRAAFKARGLVSLP